MSGSWGLVLIFLVGEVLGFPILVYSLGLGWVNDVRVELMVLVWG